MNASPAATGSIDWNTIAPVMLPSASVSLLVRTHRKLLTFSGSSLARGARISASSSAETPSSVPCRQDSSDMWVPLRVRHPRSAVNRTSPEIGLHGRFLHPARTSVSEVATAAMTKGAFVASDTGSHSGSYIGKSHFRRRRRPTRSCRSSRPARLRRAARQPRLDDDGRAMHPAETPELVILLRLISRAKTGTWELLISAVTA